MIQERSKLEVADNSGAKKLGASGARRVTEALGTVGDIIVASVKEVIPNSKVKKGEVVKAVIVRTRRRYAGTTFVREVRRQFAVIINQYNEPVGTRIFVPWRESFGPRGS
jgi:large subunit ribosomal protein L14